MAGAKLVLEVERHVRAPCNHLPHGVGSNGGIAPVVGPVGPGGGDGPHQLAVGVVPSLGLQLREEPRDAVCVFRLPSPCVDAVAHVSFAALAVGCERRAPYALRGRKFGAVPVGDVAYTLGGQRVARVAPFSVTLGPQMLTRLRIIWLTRPSDMPSQRARCSRGIIGWSVTRSSVRFSDGLMPKVGTVCTMRWGWGIEARLRLGDSVKSLPLGPPCELTKLRV